eukprot:scaffold35070_cov51-Isochrysis_galbana.AAC.1
MLFVAETNAEPPPRLLPHQHLVPPFTVQLWMWLMPIGHDFMTGGKVRRRPVLCPAHDLALPPRGPRPSFMTGGMVRR